MSSWKLIIFLSIVTFELLVVFLLIIGYINPLSPSGAITAPNSRIINVTTSPTPTPTPTPSGWHYDPETGHFVEPGKG
jgi:hypothetical protein